MPQGKFKVQNSAPIDKKKKKSNISRKNRPIAPKKWKYEETMKIKKLITKNVNKKVEEEIRNMANDEPRLYEAKKKKQVSNFKKTEKVPVQIVKS